MAQAQQKEEDVIKTYKMVEGDYSIQIRILEANDLVPTNSGFSIFKSKGSAVNAFVQATVGNQSRRTKVVKGQISPIFNQVLSFKLKDMKKSQLQNTTINITAYDRKNAVLGNTVIGAYELDLTSVYFSLNHELYRTYLALSDPTDEREGCMGYILANIAVLGPNDEPFIHDVSTEKKADATKGQTMMPKKINQWPHNIRLTLLKGEHMVPLDMTSAEIDAYVVVKYGGAKIKSKTVTSRNPEWYQQLNVGCMLPSQSKFVDISVYDHDLLGDDDLVGTVQVPFGSINEQESPPMWLNLYGAPLQGKDKEADLMNLYGATMGSHYRGRILVTMCRFDQRDSKTYKEDIVYSFPERPMPISEQKSYVLRVDLLEAHELPSRKQIIIQVKMGPYLLVSKPGIADSGSVIFNENLPDKKVLFPKSVEEIPDIIVYMADENIEDRRHSFLRIKAKEILDQPTKARVIKFREDRSLDLVTDDEFPGFLYANIQLMSTNPGQRIPFRPDVKEKIEYELRVFLYIGRNLPPADATGTSDPLVRVRCAGQLVQSKTCNQTLNPGWYETLKLTVKLYPLDKEQVVPSGMFVMVFDEDKDEDGKCTYDLIGRVWITLQPELIKFQPSPESPTIEMLYRRPKWYNILYDATDQVQGQLLLAYALIPKENAHLVPEESLYPRCEKGQINLFCIGLRNIDEMVGNIEPTNCAVSFDISGDANEPIYTDFKKVKSRAMNLNRLIKIDIDIPRNQNFCPVIDCYLWNQEPGQEKKLLGITTIDLGQLLQKFYRKLQLPPDAILEESENESSNDDKLLEALNRPAKKKKQTLALGGQDQEIAPDTEEEVDLDKIDLTVPWELPIKKRKVDDDVYEKLVKVQEQEFQRYKEREEQLLKSVSSVIDSHIVEVELSDKPIYRPTTYQQGQAGQNSESQRQQHESNQFDQSSRVEVKFDRKDPIVVQAPPPDEENQIPDDELPLKASQQLGQMRSIRASAHQRAPQQAQNFQDPPREASRRASQQSQQAIPQQKIEAQTPQQSEQQPGKQQQTIPVISQNQLINFSDPTPQSQAALVELQQSDRNQHQQPVMKSRQASVHSQKSQVPQQSPKSMRVQQDNLQAQQENGNCRRQSQDQFFQAHSPILKQRDDFSGDQSVQRLEFGDRQQQILIGQIQNDLRNQGSQRSIRQLSQIDNEIVFNSDQHYLNQAAIQKEISRRQSVQSHQSVKADKAQEVNKSLSLQEKLQQLPEGPKLYKSLKVPTDLKFSQASKVSSKALSINDNKPVVVVPPGNKGTGKKKKKEIKKNKLFSVLAFMPRKKKVADVETYEDYDTDPGEDLDITPEWLKGRKFLKDDLEDFMKPSKNFLRFEMKNGQSRGKDQKFLQEKSGDPQPICDFKCIFLEQQAGKTIDDKKEIYQKMMRPKPFSCRLYVLQGVDIQSSGDEPPDLYIKIKTAEKVYDLKQLSIRRSTNNPQFYFPYEIMLEVPGACQIEIQLWADSTLEDEMLGSSLIDLEHRYFSVKWHKFEQKPIENRNLKDEFGSSIGRLQMWIDLVEKAQTKANPMIKITAPPRYEFELRAIIYETRNCVFKDELEKCNDLYCKGGIANQELQETDTHWRCRAKGSFNWRVKNKVWYPPLPDDFGTDRFKLQLWDKDIVGSDELIGEASFNLHTHKMIDKAVKRLKPVQIMQRIREKGGVITDRFWLDVYHPDAVDEEGKKISQGQALVSFELLPLKEAELKPNGLGRDAPNVFPPLSEPTGRLSFDITNPLQFFKDVMGPELYNKICKFLMLALCLTAGVALGWMFLGPLIASAITR